MSEAFIAEELEVCNIESFTHGRGQSRCVSGFGSRCGFDVCISSLIIEVRCCAELGVCK